MSRQSLAMSEVFYRDRMFLCCNRVGNGGEALCRNRIFYVATKCGQIEGFVLRQINSML